MQKRIAQLMNAAKYLAQLKFELEKTDEQQEKKL